MSATATIDLEPKEWLSLYDSTEILIQQLASDSNDRSLSARARRNLSKKLTDSSEGLIRLDKSLQKQEINPMKYRIGEGEIQRRKIMLSTLRSTHSRLEQTIDSLTNNTRGGNNRGRNAAPLEETPTTAELSNQQLLQSHQEQIKLQDSKLDNILSGVSRLKDMSSDINAELNLHGELLSELDTAIDHTDNKLQRNTARIEIIEEKSGGCCGLLTMLLLLVLIVILASTNWACHIFNKSKC